MYNEELKRRFIQQYTTKEGTILMCESLFKEIEPHEQAWGMDICNRTQEEVAAVFNKTSGIREKYRLIKLNALRDYISWCVENDVPGANECSGMLVPDNTDVLKNKTFRNPLHLQKFLDVVFDDEEKNTVDNTYRCYFWLAYGGALEDDIFYVRESDVDFENMVVKCGGTEIPIYRESIKAFRKSVELRQFVYDHGIYVTTRERCPGDMLVRGLSDVKKTSIRKSISRRIKNALESGEIPMSISYKGVWLSGIFYRAYEAEVAGMPQDFRDFIEYLSIVSGKEFDGATIRRLRFDYLNDYNRWKETLK